MSPALRDAILRAEVGRLDQQMREWMTRVATPRLTELRDALTGGEYAAACQITIIDVNSILLAMPTPTTDLQALAPAHVAARGTYAAWMDLRVALHDFCKGPEAAQAPAVLQALEGVTPAFERFKVELERLLGAERA